MYIAPSSGHEWLNLNLPFELMLRKLEVVSDVWSENAALFDRLVEIHKTNFRASFLLMACRAMQFRF